MVRAAHLALQGGDDRIGVEHLLLGLLAGSGNAAVRRLGERGVTYDAVSAEIGRLRG